MRKVFIYLTTSLDGFIAGPNNELDWMLQTADPELIRDMVTLFEGVDAGFLGYPTYAGMIPYWQSVAADPSASEGARDIANAVNKLRPIAISRTPVELLSDNSALLVAKDDDALVEAVTSLKQQPGKDLGVSGGVRTAQQFVRLGLVDEYVLHVHPVALGAGKPLFEQRVDLELISTKAYASGVVRARYRSR
jgi:dihydrofolate reductase